MKLRILAGTSVLAVMAAGQAWAGSDYSAAWQAQIGDTAAVQTTAKGGAGVIIGVVDTGLAAANPEVAGRVSTASSCAAVSFKCSSGFNDDNGHGTSVASIAAGRFSATAPMSMSGVAPAATIVSAKVLNASGSGYDSDVANGIIKATNAGAKVINLSLTYLPTTAVLNAVNYATANNAVIVWAGGNSSVALNNGLNTNGLTTASVSRIIFVGSVGATNKLSSFSNTPGAGAVAVGTARTSYASLWLMANGENIVTPGIQYGASAFAYWTGTSMAAPEVAGAVALLEAAWPVLQRNGTASSVLFKTARDLGAAGVDTTYGNGLLNLTQAFQPIGTLSVTGAQGQSIAVSSLTTSMVTSGALGPVTQVKAQLANYTAFDSYQRNFTVDLSKLIATASTSSAAAPPSSTTTTTVVPAGKGFAIMTASRPVSFAEGLFGNAGADDIANRMFGVRQRGVAIVTLVGGDGSVVSLSRGARSTLGFSQAMWGAEGAGADQARDLGVAAGLMELAQGGYAGAIGAPLAGGRLRIAAAWTQTDLQAVSGLASDRTRSSARAAAFGVTATLAPGVQLGASYSRLDETNGLLGATYDGAGALTLGAHHESRMIGVQGAVDLGGGRRLLAEAAWASTDGAALSGGLFRQISPLTARSYGVSFEQSDALRVGDALTLSVKKPLRVTSGTASMVVTSVDSEGYGRTSFTAVDLTPTGDETDVALAYGAPLSDAVRVGARFALRQDAENVRGQTDAAFRLAVDVRF